MEKLYIILLIISLGFVSCDNLLDKQVPPHDLEGNNSINNESSALKALNGLYQEFQYCKQWGGAYIADGAIRCTLFDGSGIRGGSYKESLELFRVTYDKTALSNAWNSTYVTINSINNFIYYVEKLGDDKFAPNRKNEMLAEAKFLRAFCHMYILKMFGHFWNIDSEYGVVMRLEPSLLSNNFMARSSVKESYDLIIKDYDFAIKHGIESSTPLSSNKYLAQAYKAEALMIRGNDGDYKWAGELADSVILKSGYILEEKYEDIFTKGLQSNELMFSRVRNEKLAKNSNEKLEDYFASNRLKPSEKYYEIMTHDDTRYDLTIDTIDIDDKDGQPRETMIYKKLYNPNNNFPMFYMRLAQMYLFKAEALYRTGASIEDVLKPINRLRNRSGNNEYKIEDIDDRTELNDIIFNEYILEVGIENSSEYYASIRFTNNGMIKANSENRKLRQLNTAFINDNQLCLPIPRDEIKQNALIVPNP